MPVCFAHMYHDGGIYPNAQVAFVDVQSEIERVWGSQSPPGLDLTSLLLKGQEYAKFAVVKTKDQKTGMYLITIATNSKTNLVEFFGLPSGAPSRVTLPADRLEEAIKKLNTVV